MLKGDSKKSSVRTKTCSCPLFLVVIRGGEGRPNSVGIAPGVVDRSHNLCRVSSGIIIVLFRPRAFAHSAYAIQEKARLPVSMSSKWGNDHISTSHSEVVVERTSQCLSQDVGTEGGKGGRGTYKDSTWFWTAWTNRQKMILMHSTANTREPALNSAPRIARNAWSLASPVMPSGKSTFITLMRTTFAPAICRRTQSMKVARR